MGCVSSKPFRLESQGEDKGVVVDGAKTSNPPAVHVQVSTPSETRSGINEGHILAEIDGEDEDVVVGGTEVDPTMPDYEPPPPPPPEMEQLRCQAVRDMGLDLQSDEPSLDFITQICSDIFQVPICAVMLMDETSMYIKSTSAKLAKKTPTDRRISFAAWMMLSLKPELLVIEDFQQDKRFQNHPLVTGKPRFRSFCGAPLLDRNGHRIGILEVLDFRPRKFSAEQCAILCNFAVMIMKEIFVLRDRYCRMSDEVSRDGEKLSSSKLLSFVEASNEAVVLLEMSKEKWPVVLGNKQWNQDIGIKSQVGKENCFWDTFQLAYLKQQDSIKIWESFEAVMRARKAFDLDVVPRGGSKDDRIHMHFKPATLQSLEGPQTKIPAISNSDPTQDEQVYYLGTITSRSQKRVSPVGSLSRYLYEASSQAAGAPAVEGVVLGALLGRGSYGSVHKATWHGEKVAVKVSTKTCEEESKADAEQMEVLLGLKLNHPNVVKTLASGSKRVQDAPFGITSASSWHAGVESSNWSKASLASPSLASQTSSRSLEAPPKELVESWIVLELCNLGSLQEAIDRADFKKVGPQAKWIPDEALITRIALEVASGMAHLHAADVLHADLNGNNVLLSRPEAGGDFHAKVSDFGLSRAYTTQKTIATQTYGTVTHMPPELLAEGRLSKAADVYAFGVLLWELVTGDRPYAGLRHAQIINRKMQDLPSSQLQWPAGISSSLKAIGQKCLLSDPHERPTFAEVVAMLQPLRNIGKGTG